MKKVVVIGSGFSSLSAATYLAQAGFDVSLYEKNDTVGGRCRQFTKDGFTFDMGPSWYWMPDIFDDYFADFGRKTSEFYALDRLDPGYQIVFEDRSLPIGASVEAIAREFEAIEPNSGSKLKAFLKKAATNYEIAIKKIVLRPGKSPLELITP